MFTVEKVQFIKSAHETETSINLEARRECEDIMKTIYNENPSYWPHGLDIAAHDGGVYMIREASTRKPIGFTGWQERMDGDTKVGFYSIGILPEYRNNGYAKQAVAKLISIKAANVDRVKALVMKHNRPSLALADALHIPVVKAGSEKKAMQLLKNPAIIGGAGNAALWDYLSQEAQPWQKEYWQDTSRHRLGMALLNSLLGAGGGHAIGKGLSGLSQGVAGAGEALAGGAGTIALSPVKDLILNLLPASSKVGPALDAATKPAKGFLEGLSTNQKLLGGGLGLAGLLTAGYLGSKGVGAVKDLANAQQARAGGRVRVALPTKDPNDEETTIELPIDDLDVSKAQFGKLQRDLRRRIRKETKERTAQRTLGGFLEPKEATAKKGSLQRVNYLLNILNA
jgi:hypothetical protein